MNHMLVDFSISGVDSLVGIYPSYEEANFIRSKARFPNQCIISETDNKITTDRVGDFLRRTRQWWEYSKN